LSDVSKILGGPACELLSRDVDADVLRDATEPVLDVALHDVERAIIADIS